MDSIQTVAVALTFVAFALLSVVAHLKLAPVPVPVRATPEPTAETVRNQLYI